MQDASIPIHPKIKEIRAPESGSACLVSVGKNPIYRRSVWRYGGRAVGRIWPASRTHFPTSIPPYLPAKKRGSAFPRVETRINSVAKVLLQKCSAKRHDARKCVFACKTSCLLWFPSISVTQRNDICFRCPKHPAVNDSSICLIHECQCRLVI